MITQQGLARSMGGITFELEAKQLDLINRYYLQPIPIIAVLYFSGAYHAIRHQHYYILCCANQAISQFPCRIWYYAIKSRRRSRHGRNIAGIFPSINNERACIDHMRIFSGMLL